MEVRPWRATTLLALAAIGILVPLDAQTLLGPTAYLAFNDSPFNGGSFSYFYLETFEDGLLNTPGVSVDTGSVLGPGGLTDSVDGDDGVIDGSGLNGHSFVYGSSIVTFTFSAGVLGSLPTHAGIVWTDGPNPVFEAFNAVGASLGSIAGASADGSNSGTTGEDRFFGAIDPGGISKISISAGTWEVDHLQYGLAAIPEPPTYAVIVGSVALGLMIRRRRSRG